MAVAASVFAFASCTDDDNNGGSGSGGFSANDPEGTVIVNLSNDGSNNINCFNGYVAGSTPHEHFSIEYGINSSNNFISKSGNWLEFACVGKISGLSSITVRDTANSGYSASCAIIPGYGYVGKCSQLMKDGYAGFNTGYIRIYVDGWIKNTDGGIIGASVKYQDNWIITGDTLRVFAGETRKKVLIEQFTGNRCQYDPLGHKILDSIINLNRPGSVFGINIHTGIYASAYTTDFGRALQEQSLCNGFPEATVNRHFFSDLSINSGDAINKDNYFSATNQMLNQISCANIAANATINRSTRELKVNVAVYYTSSVDNATHKINVALLQDSIWGSQAGAETYYPDYYNAITGEYCHMHMLRHLVTGQWGDDIIPVMGSVIRKTYNYTIPAQISNENVVLDHLKVLVFLAEGKNEIITVCNAPITII